MVGSLRRSSMRRPRQLALSLASAGDTQRSRNRRLAMASPRRHAQSYDVAIRRKSSLVFSDRVPSWRRDQRSL